MSEFIQDISHCVAIAIVVFYLRDQEYLQSHQFHISRAFPTSIQYCKLLEEETEGAQSADMNETEVVSDVSFLPHTHISPSI